MARGDERHPVAYGVTALLAVALVVGLLFGGVALVGSRVLGLTGDSDSGSDPDAADTLYLPSPTPTTRSASPSATASSSPARGGKASSPAAKPITLIAGQKRVGVYGRIDLSGTYAKGEGAVLEVQRKEGGTWKAFYSVTAVVQGGQFATNVQTSRSGVNAFRMVDSDSGDASNPVRVRVG